MLSRFYWVFLANETEIALGYATLYGDMCGGMSLIGDLSKTDVYSLSRYVNRKYGREVIPAETFAIQPSAELAAGQVDPFDYAVVAPIVVVSERAFGFDLRETIINGWEG